jgi:hypothetical protein
MPCPPKSVVSSLFKRPIASLHKPQQASSHEPPEPVAARIDRLQTSKTGRRVRGGSVAAQAGPAPVAGIGSSAGAGASSPPIPALTPWLTRLEPLYEPRYDAICGDLEAAGLLPGRHKLGFRLALERKRSRRVAVADAQSTPHDELRSVYMTVSDGSLFRPPAGS